MVVCMYLTASLPEGGAVGQAGGPGSDGPELKWMMPVVVDLSHLSQTAGGVDGADLQETSPDDTASGRPMLSLGAARKPHQTSVGGCTTNGTVGEVHQEQLRDLVGEVATGPFPPLRQHPCSRLGPLTGS